MGKFRDKGRSLPPSLIAEANEMMNRRMQDKATRPEGVVNTPKAEPAKLSQPESNRHRAIIAVGCGVGALVLAIGVSKIVSGGGEHNASNNRAAAPAESTTSTLTPESSSTTLVSLAPVETSPSTSPSTIAKTPDTIKPKPVTTTTAKPKVIVQTKIVTDPKTAAELQQQKAALTQTALQLSQTKANADQLAADKQAQEAALAPLRTQCAALGGVAVKTAPATTQDFFVLEVDPGDTNAQKVEFQYEANTAQFDTTRVDCTPVNGPVYIGIINRLSETGNVPNVPTTAPAVVVNIPTTSTPINIIAPSSPASK